MVHEGELMLKNDEIIMIRSISGSRFQFKLSEVAQIETVELKPQSTPDSTLIKTPSLITAKISVAGGVSSAKNFFSNQFSSGAWLVFSSNNPNNKLLTTGAGAGVISITNRDQRISLVPLFLHFQISSNKKKGAFAGLDAGYSFATNENINGGMCGQLNIGYQIRTGKKSALLFAVTGAIYSINTTLTELNLTGSYRYEGATTIVFTGIKTSWKF